MRINRSFAAVTSLLVIGVALAQECRAGLEIAYDNANLGQTNQDYGGSLGLLFNVNTPITVAALGAYDSGNSSQLIGADGSSGVTVQIYTTGGSPVGTPVVFTPTNAGTQINADAFLWITPLTLPVGSYAIVAFNDNNYNTNGGFNATSTLNTFGGAISFVGGGNYGRAGSYPGTGDGGPANRYDAGTFAITPEPASLVVWGLVIAGGIVIARRRKA